MDTRIEHLKQWLTQTYGTPEFQLQSMIGDASFRRYFRIHHQDKTYVAMDAPPEKENCAGYVAVAKALRNMGLYAPEIFASDLSRGFLLITDFGDRLYLHELNSTNAEKLYRTALDALAILQTCQKVDGWPLPHFTQHFMRQELELFKEWFLQKHLNLTLPQQTEKQLNAFFDFLAETAAQQTQVFMHRDYHSANLMVLPGNQIGILDFQDAFQGPVTYDLVSLLRDCYIDWPEPLVNKLVLEYWEKLQLPHVDAEEFLRWFDLMGIQRHLKALLTFSRKYRRDNNTNYLQHIPRTLNYIIKISARYPECKFLNQFITEQVQKMRAMILAAGRGARMGALTSEIPKPLIKIGGHYLIEYSLHALIKIGIKDIVINIAYRGEQIKQALGDGTKYGVQIQYSEEAHALETGGGILQALPLLGPDPFIVLSCDVITDYPLQNLPKHPKDLAHLVLVDNPTYHPKGDFCLSENKIYCGEKSTLTFSNIGVYRPELFAHRQPGFFRLGTLLREAILQGKVTGEHYRGIWHNLGTEEDIKKLGPLTTLSIEQ